MTNNGQKQKNGVSLAKGPVGLIGLLALLYGISALLFGAHGFATQQVPNGAVHGKTWLGLEVNGWSALVFIAAGLLLLFGAPLHWGAKGMSLLVGLVLAAAALIALVRGDGVFGLLAANGRTELVWGAGGLLLILLSLLPRVGGKTKREGSAAAGPSRAMRRLQRQPSKVEREPAGTHTRFQEDAKDTPPPAGAYKTDKKET
ncbi:MAG: hypothetical protein M3076_05635 [Actinomycetota bacterium]|nr:hypothetical protein [Actinomycetota bacterium]